MAVFKSEDPSATSGPTVISAGASGRETIPAGLPAESIPVRDSAEKVLPSAHLGRRQLATAMLFGLVSLGLLLAGLGNPRRMYFDEGYFVPEARALPAQPVEATLCWSLLAGV